MLATSRHITGGGVDLLDVTWDAPSSALSGRSQVVANDAYDIYLTEPTGWTLASFTCDGAETVPVVRLVDMTRVGCRTSASRDVTWHAQYRHR